MKGLTLRQLVTATPAVVQKASKTTKVTKAQVLKLAAGTQKLEAIVQRTGLRDNKDHPPHVVSIETIEPKLKFSVSKVKVSCDCEAFTYWGIEYTLHKKGAAEIKHSNGKPPDIRNPARVVYLCPHLTKLALAVLYKEM